MLRYLPGLHMPIAPHLFQRVEHRAIEVPAESGAKDSVRLYVIADRFQGVFIEVHRDVGIAAKQQ